MLGDLWFVIKRINLRRAAGHEQLNHMFRFRREVRKLGRQWRSRVSGRQCRSEVHVRLCEYACQTHRSESRADLAKGIATTKGWQWIAVKHFVYLTYMNSLELNRTCA